MAFLEARNLQQDADNIPRSVSVVHPTRVYMEKAEKHIRERFRI